jgi:spermidine/putrescine transport system permease protein
MAQINQQQSRSKMAIAHAGSTKANPSPKKRGNRMAYFLLAPGLAWLLIFFAFPLINLAETSTKTPSPTFETGEFVQTFRFTNFVDAFVNNQEQFYRSFLYALTATIFALAIAYPLAYAIAFRSGPWKNLMLILVVAPFFTSFLLRTLAWKQILGAEGPVVSTLQFLGILPAGATITATAFSVILGLTYNFLPFMTLPIYASLDRIDYRLLEASGDLYANGVTTFRKVTLPLSAPGVVAGTLLTFIPASGDYINAQLLGSPENYMIGNVINSRFFRVVDYPTAAALSFILMATILVLVVIYIRRLGTDELV